MTKLSTLQESYVEAAKAGRLVYEWAPVKTNARGRDGVVWVMADAAKLDGVRICVSATTAQRIADVIGASLPTTRISDLAFEQATVRARPCIQTPDANMDTLEAARVHSAAIDRQVTGPGLVRTVGKDWVLTDRLFNKPDLAANYGWHDHQAPHLSWSGLHMWQTLGTRHDRHHVDYSQTLCLVRDVMRVDGEDRLLADVLRDPEASWLISDDGAVRVTRMATTTPAARMPTTRPTLRRGAIGEVVKTWQRAIGVTADGLFGPKTEAETKAWQAARGLVADGIVGAKTWAAAGALVPALPPSTSAGDPRAPACVAALRDANARWPERRKVSDGIMGDAAHQATKSDHNLGNAVDITHDVYGGCDAAAIAAWATMDARTQYVIWAGRIWNVDRAAEGWRKYTGANGHYHHVHISVRVSRRGDAGPWPWAAKA